jgi:hypothetical protein
VLDGEAAIFDRQLDALVRSRYTRFAPGWTPGPASGTSPSAWSDRATASSSRGTTSEAGARRSTRPAWSTPDERDGHRVGAHAAARDAAGGVGGAEQGRDELAVFGPALPPLELPGREAAEVNMKPLNSRRSAVVSELSLELYLIQLDRCATYRAGITDPRPGPSTVGSSRRQLSSANRVTRFGAQKFLVGHGDSPWSGGEGRARCQEAQTPARVILGARWKAPTDYAELVPGARH